MHDGDWAKWLPPMIERAYADTSPDVRRWLGHDFLHGAVRHEVEELASIAEVGRYQHDPATGTDHHAPPPGALPRLLGVPGRGCAIAWLRAESGKPSHRFADIRALSFALDSVQAMDDLLAAARVAFPALKAPAIRLRRSAHLPEPPVPAGYRAREDMLVFAGSLTALKQTPPLPTSVRLALRRTFAVEEWYARYAAAYDAFHRQRPELREIVIKETVETLESFIVTGVVAEILVDGEWAGIVAARRFAQHGLVGFKMVEEILDARFQGKGLAAPMQRRFFDLLDDPDYPLVFGTIKSNNEPSQKTARRVGRVPVARYVFVEPT